MCATAIRTFSPPARTPELDGCVLSIPMLRGHIAFLESVKPAEGARLRESLTEALAGRKKEESK